MLPALAEDAVGDCAGDDVGVGVIAEGAVKQPVRRERRTV